MKKVSYLFLAMIVALITACGVTPEIQPVPEDLSLPVATGTLNLAFTDSVTNKNPVVVAANGDNVNASIIIKKTATGGKPKILRVFVSDKDNYRGKTETPVFEIALKNRDEQTQTIDYGIPPTTGAKVYIHFDVYDNNDKVTRKTLVVNISADAQIASWKGITLGAQSNAAASRFASATADLYKVCDLDSNMTNIGFVDITYAAIGSPTAKATLLSNPQRTTLKLSTTIPASNLVCGGGSTAGGTATYFVATPSSVDFAAANDAILGALVIPETNQDIVVEAGKTYSFVNARKKKGLIKVLSVVEGTGGTITFDVKVQK
jgi:hypothetical protein